MSACGIHPISVQMILVTSVTIDLNSFILNLIHTIISVTTTDLRYLSIWIGEHFVRISSRLDFPRKLT